MYVWYGQHPWAVVKVILKIKLLLHIIINKAYNTKGWYNRWSRKYSRFRAYWIIYYLPLCISNLYQRYFVTCLWVNNLPLFFSIYNGMPSYVCKGSQNNYLQHFFFISVHRFNYINSDFSCGRSKTVPKIGDEQK